MTDKPQTPDLTITRGTAYDLHSGFEINEGGDGDVDWDVKKDAMSIEHREHFTEIKHYSHEGV